MNSTARAGITYPITTSCGTMLITINTINCKPVEVLINIGKCGGCALAQSEASARLISLILQKSNIEISEVIRQLVSIQCNQPILNGATSCADAIAKVLSKYNFDNALTFVD